MDTHIATTPEELYHQYEAARANGTLQSEWAYLEFTGISLNLMSSAVPLGDNDIVSKYERTLDSREWTDSSLTPLGWLRAQFAARNQEIEREREAFNARRRT